MTGEEQRCAPCRPHWAFLRWRSMAPKLAGKSSGELDQAMQDYKSGKKDNAMMKSQTTTLTADDMANLAAYYASLK
jgi:cytochrome c553